ncbi:MAG: heparinase II/III family protein [Deltaproteobacteria bacterium]
MNIFTKYYYFIRLIPKLGFFNVIYNVYYKIALKRGFLKKRFPVIKIPGGIIFRSCNSESEFPDLWVEKVLKKANEINNGVFTYFSHHKFDLGEKPNWFYNPFSNQILKKNELHWTEIDDFNSGIGDIKTIWELSRFDWVTDLARAYKISGKNIYLERLNFLLTDWTEKNPLNQGPNWKCGQEASIRIMKLLTTSFILDQFEKPEKKLIILIKFHLDRIKSNLTYAEIQNNNHIISESSALYIGSLWLKRIDPNNVKFERISILGRQLLEKSLMKLILHDGTFAQKSTNYQRVVIDTLSFVMHMLKLLKEPFFNDDIAKRLYKLGLWQYKLTFGLDGDVPNYGANDGAMIENLHSSGYRDFRVSTQLFFALLINKRIYDNNDLSEPLYWRIGKDYSKLPLEIIELNSHEIIDNHLIIIRKNDVNILFLIPEDTFRPGNDGLHIDIWISGKRIFVDAGTYSYNSTTESDVFKSVKSHNTIQFDDHEQMPKISRFLNAEWIKPINSPVILKNDNKIIAQAGFKDFKSNYHFRKLTIDDYLIKISDKIESKERAVFRIHYIESNFKKCSILINALENYKKNISFESLYYMDKSEIEYFETDITGNCHEFIIEYNKKQ